MLRFDHLCTGNWNSMVNLSPRLPVRDWLPIKQPEAAMATTQSLQRKINEHKKGSNIKEAAAVKETRLVTEKPDFELIDEDYLL